MKRISFIDPSHDESPEQINWYNLKEADTNLDLSFFISAATCWINLNPTKNYQDLEKELRNRNFNTYLYAKTPKLTPDAKLGLYRKNDTGEYKYECIFSCRPAKYALEEVLSVWPSYKDNFENLSVSGSLIKNTDVKNNDEDTQYFTEGEIDMYDLITKNKKKIVYELIDPEKYMSELFENCNKEFGKKPKEQLVGMAKNGPIFAWMIDDKIVDSLGFSIEYVDKQKVMKLVDISKMFQ